MVFGCQTFPVCPGPNSVVYGPVIQKNQCLLFRESRGNSVWSSISVKNRSLYSILDLLYFMLPYTMRHPTVLISWFNFSILHGTFCFSHSISRYFFLSATFIERSTMQVSTFEVLFSTSKFMYSASFDILPQSIERGHRGRS